MARRRAPLFAACAVFASFLLGASEPDADAIFSRARQVWDAQAYPTRIDYVVAVRVVQNGVIGTKHYEAEFAPGSTDLHVTAASEEQLAHPEPPHGINVRITREARGQKSVSIPVNPEGPTDYLGVPLLFPTYSFGLAHSRGAAAEAAPEASPAAQDLGVIGSVVARARLYTVSYLGEEDYPQGRAHHLALRPVRDPARYRLRELWVDTARFTTVKALTEGNFSDGTSTRVNWTITFRVIDGAQYIDTETAAAPVKNAFGQKFDEASVSFESIQAHHGMPALRFMMRQLPVLHALREPTS